MNNEATINLQFDDFLESFCLIKFGKKEHLEQIREGVLRFSHLEKYRKIENENIGDEDEGIESIVHKNNGTKFFFAHPLINDGENIDYTDSISLLKNYPNTNKFIFCLSYFSINDIIEKTIFSDEVLSEKEWDSVLFILDPKGFINNVTKSISNFLPILKKVSYVDFSVNRHGLDEFTKSLKYQHHDLSRE